DANHLCQLWHKAYEYTYYDGILEKLTTHQLHKTHKVHEGVKAEKTPKKEVQAIFCIDARECSFRRHLEEKNPQIETFSWAGFFGLAIRFQSLNDATSVPLCPVNIVPEHVVREEPAQGEQERFLQQKSLTKKRAKNVQM